MVEGRGCSRTSPRPRGMGESGRYQNESALRISPPAHVARPLQTAWLIFAFAKRTLPSPRSTLHPLGCSEYIWQTLAEREFGGWIMGGFSPGLGPLWTRIWVAATSQSENANLGVGQITAPGTTPTHVLSLKIGLCSPKKIVLESPSVTELAVVRELR